MRIHVPCLTIPGVPLGALPALFALGALAWVAPAVRAQSDPVLKPRVTTTTTTTTTTSTPARAKYRVTLTGIMVRSQTADDPLQIDGKGDEVFFAAYVASYDRANPAATVGRMVRSVTYGDVNGYTDRILAGTASAQGGIVSTNNVPNVSTPWLRQDLPRADQLPLLLWEGELVQGQSVVIVTPAVWEKDFDGSYYNTWAAKSDEYHRALMAKDGYAAWTTYARLDPIAFPQDPAYYAWTLHTALDRPVGMKMDLVKFWFEPRGVVLTYDGIEAAFKAGTSTGARAPGVVEVPFRDWDNGKGDYSLFLQVERLP
jgi:hypothetical protein